MFANFNVMSQIKSLNNFCGHCVVLFYTCTLQCIQTHLRHSVLKQKAEVIDNNHINTRK